MLTFCHFRDWKTFEVRNISTLFLNFEFFFLIINDDKIFFKNIMSIFVSNNFHLWIEELKDLILKIKIWKYINSYDKIEKFRKEIFSETDHFVVKQFDFTLSTIVNHLITDQINEFAQFLQSRVAKYFFELTFQQQENYRTDVKEYKRRKKQIVKIIQKMLKTNEIIRA